MYCRLGGRVNAISCWDNTDKKAYTYRKADGINVEELVSITDAFGSINKEKAKELGYELLDGSAWIEQDVDILIPAALENQITSENVDRISRQVKIIVEAANGPTTTEADKAINGRGIFLVPDFLANAGGVTCSYFEQVQCNMNYFWDKDEVLSKLDRVMTSAFHAVYDLSAGRNFNMRDAAYVIAIERVVKAVKSRGWA
jgi:glutamate dehydrogenase (NAD(P)+)